MNLTHVVPLLGLCALMTGAQHSCGPSGEDDCPELRDLDDDGRIPALTMTSRSPDAYPRDRYWVESWKQDCDLLYLQVQYSGGCAEHDFALYASEAFAESYPVQVTAWLSHEDHDDPCEALPIEEQVYDLTPLKEAYIDAYGSADVIVVHLLGPEGQDGLSFEYDLAD